MKKTITILLILATFPFVGCHAKQESAYNRTDDKQDYERFMRAHVFAACKNIGLPYATYSLAKLNERPSNDSPYYKVTFVNGECKGKTIWTKDVITKTEPLGAEHVAKGTVLISNYNNPKDPFDQQNTSKWNIGVVVSSERVEKGIIDLEFPRDKNDFIPAREGVYTHNARYIVAPVRKDIRTFL